MDSSKKGKKNKYVENYSLIFLEWYDTSTQAHWLNTGIFMRVGCQHAVQSWHKRVRFVVDLFAR